MVGNNPVSERYVALKKRAAERAGIAVTLYRFPHDASEEALAAGITDAVSLHDGYIIQLPLPAHINGARILDLVPRQKDVDMLSSASMDAFYRDATPLLPPVIGVFSEIITRWAIPVRGKRVAVVGRGRLVGAPAAHWFRRQGALVGIARRGEDIAATTAEADIIVLGAGSPGLLKPAMVKTGVVILDAGTSEDGGALKGDADPAVAEKSSLFTPVPGGIGPVTVVMLFKNLLTLYTHGT